MKKILRDFKNRIEAMKSTWRAEHTVYICDPERATDCPKTGCWYTGEGPCKCTLKKRQAKRGENGKRIIATDDDVYNTEWLEEIAFKEFQKSQKKQGL